MTCFSLNEIEAMGKRAARGAGLTWGLAEEAGKAVRWLTACQLPGPEMLNEILTFNDGTDYVELSPVSVETVWQARSGRLCPLVAGPSLSDHALDLAAGGEIELGKTIKPLMLAAYAAVAAKFTGVAIELVWPGAIVIVTPQGISIEGDHVNASLVEGVRCRRTATKQNVTEEGLLGREVDVEAWDNLSLFMHRYLAPNTEESRAAGAGPD